MKKHQRKTRTPRTVFVCGPSTDYYYGDPQPSKGLGYMEFLEWQEAQLTRRRRPKVRP